MRRALETAAKQFAWKPAKTPSGRGVGVALQIYSTSTWPPWRSWPSKSNGKVKVKRVVTGLDAGLIVNPDGFAQQMERLITMGLGYTLTRGGLKDGEVLDHNFDKLPAPAFSWLSHHPDHHHRYPDLPSQGCGEPAITTMVRWSPTPSTTPSARVVLQLPMTPARVLEGD